MPPLSHKTKRQAISGKDRFGRLAPLTTAILCLFLFGISAEEGITWGDSAEIAQATHLLGVMHPTGYPFFILINKLLTGLLFFIEDPARRLNLVVAFWGAASAGMLSLLAQKLAEYVSPHESRNPWASAWAGILAGLVYGLSPLFWEQARIAEVYTLHVFLVATALYGFLRFEITGERKYVIWAALPIGLGLANHLTISHLFPAALVYILLRDRKFLLTRHMAFGLGIGVATLLLYLYLPIADRTTSGFPWGGTSEWGHFWYHVSGSHYHHYLFESVESLRKHLQAFPAIFLKQLGFGGAIFFPVGLYVLGRRSRSFLIFLGLFLLTGWVHAMGYNVGDYRVYLCAPFFVIALLSGAGFGFLLSRFAAKPALLSRTGLRLAVMALPVSAALGLLGAGVHYYGKTYRNIEAFVPAMAEAVNGSIEPGSILLQRGDTNNYSTWYVQNVKGVGRDFAAVNVLRVRDRWYTDFLRRRWPWLDLPTWVGSIKVVRGVLRKYGGKRKIYTRGVFNRKKFSPPKGFRLLNRGFYNELVPSDSGSPRPVHIRESFLTESVCKEGPGLPRRTFDETERVTLYLKWLRAPKISLKVQWVGPNGELFREDVLAPSPNSRASWTSLKVSGKKRPAGLWTVRLSADGEEIMRQTFTIRKRGD